VPPTTKVHLDCVFTTVGEQEFADIELVQGNERDFSLRIKNATGLRLEEVHICFPPALQLRRAAREWDRGQKETKDPDAPGDYYHWLDNWQIVELN
jgi:hypothetical protein